MWLAMALVDERFGTDIEAQGDGGLRADLDVWGRFAYDIVDLHAQSFDRRGLVRSAREGRMPLRMILTGGARPPARPRTSSSTARPLPTELGGGALATAGP